MKKSGLEKVIFSFFVAILSSTFNFKVEAQMGPEEMQHGHNNSPMENNKKDNSNQYFNPKDKTTFTNRLHIPGGSGFMGIMDVNSSVAMLVTELNLEIIPGEEASVLVYQSTHNDKEFINPIIRLKKGSDFSLTLTNSLEERINIHWHGIHNDSKNDGIPQNTIATNGTYQYKFRVTNNSATYWYHPHTHGRTGEQVFLGLASFFIVEDPDSDGLAKALGTSLGDNDLPLVIQDKRFDEEGQLSYEPNRMEEFMGYYGDNILVNLTPNAFLPVKTNLYRFRLLNGSNARVYRLAFAKGAETLPFLVIANDGGLLDKPYQVKEAFLSPGERIEMLLDMRNEQLNSEIYLRSLQFDPMENEQGGMGEMGMGNMGTMSTSALPNGEEFYILKLVVTEKASNSNIIPQKIKALPVADEKNASIRQLKLTQEHMQWYINGQKFAPNVFPIQVKKGTKEIWEFINAASSMTHPMHIHGLSFLVLERKGSPQQVKSTALGEKGLQVTDLGYKDTVLVWPGETVRLLLDFSNNFTDNQDYVVHCHILEHEDGGMMLNYRVLEK